MGWLRARYEAGLPRATLRASAGQRRGGCGMGLFSKFFGGGGKPAAAKEGEAVEYKGFRIHPAAQPQSGKWLTAGVIRKEIDGATREHRFVWADTHGTADSANDFAVVTARTIIDEEDDGMLRDGRGGPRDVRRQARDQGETRTPS